MSSELAGKICSMIFQAGYSIHLSGDEGPISLLIGKSVNGVAHAVYWYASEREISSMSEEAVIGVVNKKMEALKRQIARG